MSRRLARPILFPPRQALRAPALEAEAPKPKPYKQSEAVVDALAGREACKHGLWPHQGECGECMKEGQTIAFVFDGLFSRDVQ